MNFDKSLLKRNFFRFTGPPENWLTAIKFMTWGLEKKYESRWSEIQPGDVFFMHSTSTGSKFKNAKSSIIGLGVIGSNFTIKDSYLWIKEYGEKTNIWPLLVPFSEIYLLSDLPNSDAQKAYGVIRQNVVRFQAPLAAGYAGLPPYQQASPVGVPAASGTCSKCGAGLSAGQKFCGTCGAPV